MLISDNINIPKRRILVFVVMFVVYIYLDKYN